MAAVLQFEINRKRVDNYPRDSTMAEGGPTWKYQRLLQAALYDTLKNGGTFVVVVSPEKLTAIQRTDAEDI